MAVHKYRRARDGATVYCAAFFGPDGTRRVRKVKVVPAEASARAHARAETAARQHAHEQRVAVENGEWQDPRDAAVRKISVSDLVDKFLADYRPRSGSTSGYYTDQAKVIKEQFRNVPASAVIVGDVDAFRKRREGEVGSS